MANEKVFVMLCESKHMMAIEGASVYRSYDGACRAVGEMILEDIDNDRYCDAEEVAEKLTAAIKAERWQEMFDLHESYWSDFASPDVFVIHECELGE